MMSYENLHENSLKCSNYHYLSIMPAISKVCTDNKIKLIIIYYFTI